MRFFGMEIFQSGGTYSSLPSVPKNEIILFEKDTVVLGYTLLSDVDDEVIYITKGSAAGGTAGGTDEQFDPVSLGLIAAGVGAASTGLTAARLAAQRKNRKKCIAFASQIDNPEERKKAFVRCYQAGQG